MTAALLDTHAWYWLFTGEKRLPDLAARTVEEAASAVVCSISLYEIARKARIGKWPGVDADALHGLLRESGRAAIDVVPASPAAMIEAGRLDWDHRDPWDRLIAATALERRAVLVSADPAFDAVRGLERHWR